MNDLYKELGLLPTSKNNMVSNLYRIPKKDKGVNAPKFQPIAEGQILQADLLFMPNDNGYKYALVVVDSGSRHIDAEPLKDKESSTVLTAFKEIFKRGYVQRPAYRLEVDSGSEFKGVVNKYFEKMNIHIRIAKAGRSRQQALVERVNQSLATLLFKRQTAEELLTGVDSKEWVYDLSKIVPLYNKMIDKKKRKLPKDTINDDPVGKGDTLNLLAVGQNVRVQLDHPINVANDRRLHGHFRSTDIRWSPQIRVVKEVILKPGFPPLYLLDGAFSRHKIEPVAYTKAQLQVVKENEKMPEGDKIIRGKPTSYKVQEILGKKYVKNEVFYKIKWLGYAKSASTWEPRSTLIKEIPDMIKEFELKFMI